MASPYRLEQIVQEFQGKHQKHLDLFEQMLKEGGFRRYDFIENAKNIRPWDELDDACKECIYSQIEKYKAVLHMDGTPLGNRFTVPCEGIPKDYIKPAVLKQLQDNLGLSEDSEEIKHMKSLRDPVAWARANCIKDDSTPWVARDYQEVMLRCTSRRAVFRCGRRSGKSDALAAYCLFAAMMKPFYARDRETGKILYDRDGAPVQKPLQILIVTPRQTHADNLMAKIKGFIDRNQVLSDSIESYVKSPYYRVEFKNGSKIICITSGTGTSGSGVAVRSFDADILILDEANYLGAADLKAIMAILSTSASTILRASSTPIGAQDFFWEWCENNAQYKAFHYPTFVVPDWEEMRLSVYSDVETEDDFLHEYMAVFSPPEHGVFRPDLVRLALDAYVYEDCKPRFGCIYSVGVDWNSNAGTEIFVIEYDTVHNAFKAVEAINVPKSEWTQLNALNHIINMVKKWNPAVVCVDEGAGSTQVELLKRYSIERGKNHPATRKLYQNLIAYNFSSSIEVADPVNGEISKKPAKPFLVQNAVRRFEEENIKICKHDDTLQKQLLAYIVKKYSANGRPVYAAEPESTGDHRLDAFMLSLVGLRLKFGNLHIPPYVATGTNYIHRADNPREGGRSSVDLDEVVAHKLGDRDLYAIPKEELDKLQGKSQKRPNYIKPPTSAPIPTRAIPDADTGRQADGYARGAAYSYGMSTGQRPARNSGGATLRGSRSRPPGRGLSRGGVLGRGR